MQSLWGPEIEADFRDSVQGVTRSDMTPVILSGPEQDVRGMILGQGLVEQ